MISTERWCNCVRQRYLVMLYVIPCRPDSVLKHGGRLIDYTIIHCASNALFSTFRFLPLYTRSDIIRTGCVVMFTNGRSDL